MRCPRGSPRLTSMPLRTTNGFLSRTLESAAGTSTCQPVRSLPLKRDCAGPCDSQRDAASDAATEAATTRDDFTPTSCRGPCRDVRSRLNPPGIPVKTRREFLVRAPLGLAGAMMACNQGAAGDDSLRATLAGAAPP